MGSTKDKGGVAPSPQAPSAAPPRSFLGILKENRLIIRFVFVTLASLLAFFIILHFKFVQRNFVSPYTGFVASSSRFCLRLIGIEAGGEGSVISSPQFTVNILNICNGLEATAIFFATVLGFPATVRNKLVGLAIGYPAIYAINIFRIIVLFLLGLKVPRIFETVHYYYAQAFVILATIGVWLLWVSVFSTYGTKDSEKPSH